MLDFVRRQAAHLADAVEGIVHVHLPASDCLLPLASEPETTAYH